MLYTDFCYNSLSIPSTVIFKIKKISLNKYEFIIHGIFGSIVTRVSVDTIVYLTKNIIYLIYNKNSFVYSKSLAISESKKVSNLLYMLHKGYWTTLRLIGKGFKVVKQQLIIKNMHAVETLILSFGFSHNIYCEIPKGINIIIKKRTIRLWSHSFSTLRNFSYKLFFIKRKIDNYKCTGIVPAGFYKKLKVGKVSRV